MTRTGLRMRSERGRTEKTDWRFALASALGTSHAKTGAPCQDASACEFVSHADAPLLVAVVADGAGSARWSQNGARLACQVVQDETRKLLEAGKGIVDIDRAFALHVLRRFQTIIGRVARRCELRPRDFACTLLVALVGQGRSAFFQVGDGAIVLSRADARFPEPPYEYVFWPQQGEYANETFFATAWNAYKVLQFEAFDAEVEELALFSDGLQSLVLDYEHKRPHDGFFRPMFRTVRRLPQGHSSALSRHLEHFLGSRAVTSKTDDDKSLVLATRRVVTPRAPLPHTPAAPPVHALTRPRGPEPAPRPPTDPRSSRHAAHPDEDPAR